MTFYPGQEVVVVGAPPGVKIGNGGKRYTSIIPEGIIVVVREVDMRGLAAGHEAPTLRFVGLFGEIIHGWEVGYDARCFRPVDKKRTKTDISIFKKMLAPKCQHESV